MVASASSLQQRVFTRFAVSRREQKLTLPDFRIAQKIGIDRTDEIRVDFSSDRGSVEWNLNLFYSAASYGFGINPTKNAVAIFHRGSSSRVAASGCRFRTLQATHSGRFPNSDTSVFFD